MAVPDPLQTLESDLNTLATVNSGATAAQPTAALTGAQAVLSLLANSEFVGDTIGGAVSGFYDQIAEAIQTDVVATLQAIGGQLSTLDLGGTSVSDVASALSALQNALQTAQSLMPGSSSAAASAFAATSQFATLFGDLLSAPDATLADAAKALNDIALQLGAIAKVFTEAAGTP
jgi:hypothetical protein